MLPQYVNRVSETRWLDTREQESCFHLCTIENETIRPLLLPGEERILSFDKILLLLRNIPHLIVLCTPETLESVPTPIKSNPRIHFRVFSKERIAHQVPRRVNIWVQWFPHSNIQRSQEYIRAFTANCDCPSVSSVIQLNERDYSLEDYPHLSHSKVKILPLSNRITYNDFFRLVRSQPINFDNFLDIHVLINADIEWTNEASLGLEHYLWEGNRSVISPLRWEDRRTLFGSRSDSQDAWAIVAGDCPDDSRLNATIPLGMPGCDNRILMELLLQGYHILNRPLQFPTIHHHKTEIRSYTSEDMVKQPYLMVRPQWQFIVGATSSPPFFIPEVSWLLKAGKNLRNRCFPELTDNAVSEMLRDAILNPSYLRGEKGLVVGKIGCGEMRGIYTAQEIWREEERGLGIRRIMYPEKTIKELHVNAGVFPADRQGLDAFVRRYMSSISKCDILSYKRPWVIPNMGEEMCMTTGNDVNPYSCRISATEPFQSAYPFTSYLVGKSVVVVSPFVRSMQQQYLNRRNIWGDRVNDFLPEFSSLRFVKAPLSAGLVPPIDEDWGAMADRLIGEIFPEDNHSSWPDVLLCGCGPVGLVLCVAAKERGRVGVSFGGSLQILFGIRGKRWDMNDSFKSFINDYWIRPTGDEIPTDASSIEGACYW